MTFDMFMARQDAEWERTAQQMALKINANLKKGKRKVNPGQLNPFRRRKTNTKNKTKGIHQQLAGENMVALFKSVFGQNK